MKQSANYSDVNAKLSVLVMAHPELLLTLSHFGIGLGVGDGSIGEVCRRHGVSPDFFLLICNLYAFENFVPTAESIAATDMSGLLPYLLRSHAYYLDKRLPHIGSHLEKIAQMLPERAAKVIMRFYEEYVSEVDSHFCYEEDTVFPHISRLLSGHAGRYRIEEYLHNHGNLEDKLSDLTQIMFKYLPTELTDADAIDMIFDILELGRDLHKHSLIEERILVPYVSNLEKQVEP